MDGWILPVERGEVTGACGCHRGKQIRAHSVAGILRARMRDPSRRSGLVGSRHARVQHRQDDHRSAMLNEEIRRTKARRVGTHDSEFIDGSVALAVPVTDARGHVYAGLAVHAPSSRMSIESAMEHVATLQQGQPQPLQLDLFNHGYTLSSVLRGCSATAYRVSGGLRWRRGLAPPRTAGIERGSSL